MHGMLPDSIVPRFYLLIAFYAFAQDCAHFRVRRVTGGGDFRLMELFFVLPVPWAVQERFCEVRVGVR